MLDDLKNEMERQFFRGQVGRQMFCRGCSSVLDVRRAVGVDVWSGDDLLTSLVLCGKCFDLSKNMGGLDKALDKAGDEARLETFDGRERW